MALFEHQPYTNFENINLDMILNDIKIIKENEESLDSRMDALEASYTTINESITNIQTDITTIYEQIGEIDLSSLESRVDVLEGQYTTLNNHLNNITLRLVGDEENIDTNTDNIDANNTSSINRDNALSARISQLERATLHDIFNYYAEGNMLLFGSDLRNLPSSCKEGGYPKGYGNRYNKHLAVGTDSNRAWKLTTKGFEVDTTSASSYDYYQMGKFNPSLGVVDSVTVTFCVSTGGDSTPSAWYSHTFTAQNDQWTIRNGCVVRFGTYLDNDNTAYSVQFLGTPNSWLNIVPSGSCIPFIYVEYGTGSVDTSASAKPKFNSKDRLFFEEESTPVLPAPSNFAQNISHDVDAFYYDAVGEQVNYKLPTTSNVRAWWFNKMLNGFITINCRPTSTASGVTQLDGINENGCYSEFDLDLSNSTIPNIAFNRHFPVFDMIGNKQGEAYLAKNESDTTMTKVHVKLSSTGFVIDGVTDKYLQIPFDGLLQ